MESKSLQSVSLFASGLQFAVLLIYFIIQGFQDTGTFSYNRNLAALPLSYFVVLCASQWVKVLLKARSRLLNFARLAKNIITCIILGVSEQFAHSDNQGTETTDTFQPLLGFLLSIELLSSLQSTNFLFKIIATVINIAFYTITYWGRSSIAISVAMSIGMGFVLVREYIDDRSRRSLFLDKQKQIELTFLIDKLLPINIVVMKYNPKEERSHLHQVNRKAQNTFNITDNDSFKALAKRIFIKTDSNDPDNDSEIDFFEAAAAAAAAGGGTVDQSMVSPQYPMYMPSMMMVQAPSMMNLNPQDMNSQQVRMQKQQQQQARLPHQRSLFYHMESIAKDAFDRRKNNLTTNEKSITRNVLQFQQQQQQQQQQLRNNESFNNHNDQATAGTGRNTQTATQQQRKKKESVAFEKLLRGGSDDRVPVNHNGLLVQPAGNGMASVLEPVRDFGSMEKLNSVESPKKGESFVLSHERRSKKDSSIDRQKINSIDHRPKGFSVEKTALANSGERERERERQQLKPSNADLFDRTNQNRRIAFDRVSGVARRTHTVKLDSLTNIPSSLTGAGPVRFAEGTAAAGKTNTVNPAHGAASGLRRQRRKSTVMRKMPNFNLNPGMAGATKKYGEEVYDRIDMLMGEFADAEGRRRQVSIKIYTYSVNEQYQVILFEEETLESQVKFLKEHNAFLYTSFTESLQEFRLPLAYSLLKLNTAFEEQKRASAAAAVSAVDDAMMMMHTSSTVLMNQHQSQQQQQSSWQHLQYYSHSQQPLQTVPTLTNIKTNMTAVGATAAQQSDGGFKQPSMMMMHQTTSDVSLLNMSPNSRKNIYPQSNQALFSHPSQQQFNFAYTASTKQNVDLFSNQDVDEQQHSSPLRRGQARKHTNDGGRRGDGDPDNHDDDDDDDDNPIIGDSMSSSSQNFINPLLMMGSTQQQQQQQQQHLQKYHQLAEQSRKNSAATLSQLGVAVDDSRYYGFLTLNAVYNYIDYISLLQRKQLEIKVTDLSMKRIIADVVSLLENQGKKKSVRIVVLNELRYDRISSDERRLKQVLLNFLIAMLEKTKKGYIAIRLSVNAKQFESIKVSITSSASNAYPTISKAKLRLNSYDDVVTARKNKGALASTVSTAIVGRIGPYSKVSLRRDKKSSTIAPTGENNNNDTTKVGTCVSFSIYQDLNILASVNRFGSVDDNDLLYDRNNGMSSLGIAAINGYKSNVNVHQEGEISELSSCDINYTVNKIIVENLNLTTRVFFPNAIYDTAAVPAGEIHSGGDRDEFYSVHQLSSKKNNISPSKQYTLYSESHQERANRAEAGVINATASGNVAAYVDYQLRSRSASSRSSDHPAYRFDGSRGVRSQNYRIPSNEDISRQQSANSSNAGGGGAAAAAAAAGVLTNTPSSNTMLLQPNSNEQYHQQMQFHEDIRSRKGTSKSQLQLLHDPIIIEDALSYGSGSERQRRSISKARHHSEFIPQNSPSIFSRSKEHFQTVVSHPKEFHALNGIAVGAGISNSSNNNNCANPPSNSKTCHQSEQKKKRDIKQLKISKNYNSNSNGATVPAGPISSAESMSQLMAFNNDDNENNHNNNSDEGSHSATLLQVKRLSKTTNSAISLKIIRGQGDLQQTTGQMNGAISNSTGQINHDQCVDSPPSNRHKDGGGIIKLQLVDLSENQGDISKTVTNMNSLTQILP